MALKLSLRLGQQRFVRGTSPTGSRCRCCISLCRAQQKGLFDSRMMGFASKHHFVLLPLEERNRNREANMMSCMLNHYCRYLYLFFIPFHFCGLLQINSSLLAHAGAWKQRLASQPPGLAEKFHVFLMTLPCSAQCRAAIQSICFRNCCLFLLQSEPLSPCPLLFACHRISDPSDV